jgi:hypothetical protein
MTELASQIYDRLTPGTTSVGRMKLPPHWVRTTVVEPRRHGARSSEPVGEGEVGLLRHVDLANVERPIAIQSEDLGRAVAASVDGALRRGFEILGRARGAEPRGCSLTADDLVEVRGDDAGAARSARA